MGPQQDASAQQSMVISPLFVGKSVPAGQTCHAAPVSQMHGQQRGFPSHSNDDFAGVDAECVDTQSHRLNAMLANASPPKTYPDTKLYQFADIELAHEH